MNMDKKMAKKPTDQNSFHGTNEYTNGSHGYISVFFVLFYFPLQNKYSPQTSKYNSRRGCRLEKIVDQDPCKSDLELLFWKNFDADNFYFYADWRIFNYICHLVKFKK